jgi:hypothetical protein
MPSMLSSRERTGVIIIRVWLEADDTDGFRARVTSVRDVEANEVDNAAASTVDEVVEMVQRFVNDFAAG